jgi:hypothetical protein
MEIHNWIGILYGILYFNIGFTARHSEELESLWREQAPH